MSVLLRTTAGQIREDLDRPWGRTQSALSAVAELLDVIADKHEGCPSNPDHLNFCPELAAAEAVASEYIGADCAKELSNA